jgi:hypothetical protein
MGPGRLANLRMNGSATNTSEPVVPDKDLPLLAQALNKEVAHKELKRRLPRLSGEGRLRLKSIQVIRHKPGRRCVAEYEVDVLHPNGRNEPARLIGKTRSGRSGNEAYRLQNAIWDAGFDSESQDGISVPEPIGVISAFQMWFQRKVCGPNAEALLSAVGGKDLAKRIAQAIHKLHQAGVPTTKAHTMADELRILRNCLVKVKALYPQWSERLERLMLACENLGLQTQPGGSCGIHRDFYAAQVIVTADRLWLIDFDLYCQGDPSLDVGNFIGHVTEQSLREYGRADALVEVEDALEDEFVRLNGESASPALHAYRDLTLVRHVFLSTQFPDRSHLTEHLLELCESRLALPPVSKSNKSSAPSKS